MKAAILDAYTDEPSGLGVPPYLGTYPRYLFGALLELGHEISYLTIDDLRNLHKEKKGRQLKTNIKTYNLTRDASETKEIIDSAKLLVVNAGIQTPGKYLSAVPGTLKEIETLIRDSKAEKVLTGPAASMGTQLIGGRSAESFDKSLYGQIDFNYLGTNDFRTIARVSVLGAKILHQIPYETMLEIETGKGCSRVFGCSFCTEPIKNFVQYRNKEDILSEIDALYKEGARNFRFGKQTSFYDYKRGSVEEIRGLLAGAWKAGPRIRVLHIDNVDPIHVLRKGGEEITKLISEHCTPGNVAAFGVETFDREVFEQNRLNALPEITLRAIEQINKYGAGRGDTGLPNYLPGINLIFGLKGETKRTHQINMEWLMKIMDSGYMVRRINLRQVTVFPGTLMEQTGTKVVRKNKRLYWKWRNEIRQKIDLQMLSKVAPMGVVLRNVRFEVHDGNTTFGRQFGTYPLIVGVKGRQSLGSYADITVEGHMLRSVIGRISGASQART